VQSPCGREDFVRGKQFSDPGHAFGRTFDVGPADDAIPVDQKLSFQLRPLPLRIGPIGLILDVAIELCKACSRFDLR
jgi:hypothetical protein